jgi:superfamily II RNA helicase
MDQNYLTTIDGSYDPKIHGDFEGEFENKYFQTKYKWDDFQLHSYQAVKRNDNLLVVAPTSSGKTSVAKYAVLYGLLEKKIRVVYTTPIKSLSNEKYAEMKEILDPLGIQTGLLTGDQKINTDATFLIMTAEILANALFLLKNDQNKKEAKYYDLDRNFVDTIGCVIMDEIHFISDQSRGHIWEDTLILLNPSVQIVGLSATIDDPESFARWIGMIKQKNITLVKKYNRPVPLEFSIYCGTDLHKVLSIDGTYSTDNFQLSTQRLVDLEKACLLNGTNKIYNLLNSFIKFAKVKELLQLCFIVFSKKNCEKFSEIVNVNLVTSKESAVAVNELERRMGGYLKSYHNMPRYRQIKSLIEKGVCFHHAGMPVILKEVVEHLFKTGHIKVLFATETIAVGVNMPIRTLVMVSCEKNSEKGIRNIDVAEFRQISGRAGRRGLDTKGLIVFLPLYKIPSETFIRTELLFGNLPKIVSRIELSYHQFLKVMRSDRTDKDKFFDNSLLRVQNKSVHSDLQKQHTILEQQYQHLIGQLDISKIDHHLTDEIEKYITLPDELQSDGGGFTMKLNKNQIKQQKYREGLIKNNLELYDKLKEINSLKKTISGLKNEIDTYSRYKDIKYEQIAKFLEKTGYLTINDQNKECLTDYGIMASQINECNPFILTEIFTGNILEQLNAKQIICFLSIFTERIDKNETAQNTINQNTPVNQTIREAVEYIVSKINEYQSVESLLGFPPNDNYWELSYDYLEITQLWVDMDLKKEDHSRILQKLRDLEEYEGSFIKNMLKINNIVNNLIMLSNSTQYMDLLPVLQEIEPLIVKGMVNVDSLHI